METRKRSRKEAILEAATHIFSAKGFHAANIIEIADKAGIGKGTVYEYFPSKKALFIETLEYNAGRYNDMIEKAVGAEDGYDNKIGAFMRFHSCFIKDNLKAAALLVKLPHNFSFSDEEKKETYDILTSSRNKTVKLLKEIICRGHDEGMIRDIDPEFAADAFLEMLTWNSIKSVMLGLSEEQSESGRNKLMDMFINGAGQKNNR